MELQEVLPLSLLWCRAAVTQLRAGGLGAQREWGREIRELVGLPLMEGRQLAAG